MYYVGSDNNSVYAITTTDGIIYSFDFTGKLPNGSVTHAQAVGHKPMSAKDYAESKK